MHFESRKLDDSAREAYLADSPPALASPMQQWIDAILRNESMSITIEDGRDLTELMQGFYMSNEQGRSIDFPL